MPAYDHPEYLITRTVTFDRLQVPVSTSGFASFRANAKIVIQKVIVGLRSVTSLKTFGCSLMHNTGWVATGMGSSVGASVVWISSDSLGSVHTMSSVNKTLLTGEYISLGGNSDGKGKVMVVYEYQVLPDVTA